MRFIFIISLSLSFYLASPACADTYPTILDEPTKTSILNEVDDYCLEKAGEVCKENLCPTFCNYRYSDKQYTGWPGIKDIMHKECLERCNKDQECKLQGDLTVLENMLTRQARAMYVQCFGEIGKLKTIEGAENTPNSWKSYTTKEWKDSGITKFQEDEKKKSSLKEEPPSDNKKEGEKNLKKDQGKQDKVPLIHGAQTKPQPQPKTPGANSTPPQPPERGAHTPLKSQP